MHPKKWGPPVWKFMFCAALEYPDEPTEEDKRNMWMFLTSLQPILPCNDCRKNFKKHLKELPLTDDALSSRENLLRWLIDQKNLVNRERNLPPLSHDHAIIEIEKMISDDPTNTQQIIVKRDNSYLPYCIIVVLIVIIFIMGFFIYNSI